MIIYRNGTRHQNTSPRLYVVGNGFRESDAADQALNINGDIGGWIDTRHPGLVPIDELEPTVNSDDDLRFCDVLGVFGIKWRDRRALPVLTLASRRTPACGKRVRRPHLCEIVNGR